MQRLQIQLLRGLGRHKLHRRALHGFGNRFGVIEVVLLSLAIGADIFGGHQPGIVTKRCEIAASGILASAVNGAIAAAMGEPMTPSKMFTLSRVMSSCATRLPTSGLVASSRLTTSMVTPAGRFFMCSLA